MKLFLSCALLCAVFVASQAYSATWGHKKIHDFWLYDQTEVRPAWNNATYSVDIEYPPPGYEEMTYKLSFIDVIDHCRNGTGSTPTLVSGGIGSTYAKVNLHSSAGHCMNSTVEFWGFVSWT
ncbi:uncharacterized protein LOC108595970 [Drosophila busckii]|uniref:uncharacterized protein LOC108595970 n=1 Tax=Drosophila busckii TaxID=30019 RepID=UPI00083EA96B|nr:uncharacterized protein LOC108595970 [Drosophila busckii]